MILIVFIVLAFIVLWLVFIRPQQRRQAEQEELLARLSVGDEIVTAGGVYGTIRALQDDVLEVEIAPGTTVRVARRAVAGRIEPEDEEELEEAEDEPAADEPKPAIPENES